MATSTELHNGHSESNGELTNAQKLMKRHAADAEHHVSVEEVADEDDLKQGETPVSASVLESADGSAEIPVTLPPKPKSVPLDYQSREAFPELGAPKSTAGTPPGIWNLKSPAAANGTNGSNNTSSDAGPAIPAMSNGGPRVVNIPGRYTDQIVMEPKHILPRQQLKKPVTEVLRDVNKKSKANVVSHISGQGTQNFTATGPTESSCRDALNAIAEAIGTKETINVQIPRSVRGYIVGKGGANIKDLQERTGARIQMPKNDNAAVNGADDDDDATIDVKIEGNHISAGMARQLILKAAEERTPLSTHKLRDIPAEFYPFIAHNDQIQALEAEKGVRIKVPPYHTWSRQTLPEISEQGQSPYFRPASNGNHIVLTGNRAAVQEARAHIENHANDLRQQLATKNLVVDSGRQQFIIGDFGIPAEKFLADTGCAVILPSDPSVESVTIIGPPDRLSDGVDRAETLAFSRPVTNVDIARLHHKAPNGASAYAQNLTRYLQARKEIERLEQLYDARINVAPATEYRPWEVYTPSVKEGNRAKTEISNIVHGHPPSRMVDVEVEPFYHQHLRSEAARRIQEQHGVLLVIPDEPSARQVLLVFEGPAANEANYQVPQAQPSAAEIQAFQHGLADARKHILDIISRQQDIRSEQLEVPTKFQKNLRKFYKQYQQKLPADQIPVQIKALGTKITLQGPASEVETLAGQMNEYLEQVKEEEKERGFTLTFDFPQKHANQLIGKGGSKISELRDKFDVEIQLKDGTVELKGPKAKAEAAKAHITQLGRAWLDEVNYVLKVEPKYHRELIGAGGAQIKKLEKRYAVDIHFPKTARVNSDAQSNADAASESGRKPRHAQADDEVTVRGPKKGSDEARDEILSLLQYLKDNSNVATVAVQQSQIPSLIGQRGSGMDELRQLTGARIDVPNARDTKSPNDLVEIQIKGSKSQVAAAKKIIEEKKTVFDDTVVKTLEVDRKHHSALIGSAGSNLRDIVIKAGGSGERRDLARTVQFPRAGTESTAIKIEGSKVVVDKIIAAMSEIVAQRESQITESVPVPASQHRSLIGRGGDVKRDLESKFHVSIDIPRQGSGVEEVKIAGQPKDVESAKDHILALVKDQAGETVEVPRNLHNTISDHGQFFRKLRTNYHVTVDHDNHAIPSQASAPKTNGGSFPLITDDQDAAADAHIWNVVNSAATGPDLEGSIPWILRGSQDNVNKAKSLLANAIEQAQSNTHTGYLVLPDPSKYRYVIGQGGSKVNGIRKQSGCRINVPKAGSGDQAIEISGSAEGIEKAKHLVLEAVKEGGNANGRS